MFNHSKLDEFGLSQPEFRLYGHLIRRANGKGVANPGITSMSRICRMKRNTVVDTVRKLEARRMVRVIRESGERNTYILTHPSEWIRPGRADLPQDTSIPMDTGVVSQTAPPPVSPGIRKGSPREGNPLKDNTVIRPSNPIPSPSPSPIAPSPEPCSPGGSSPDNEHAMSRQNAEGDSEHFPTKPPQGRLVPSRVEGQTPMRRKAYAMADHLAQFHWDNCKVRYVKETARSYSEKALGDGHDDQAIFAAYDKALRYCHGIATDEINRGERHQFEHASPALTVWLARERLKGDPRSTEERWKTITAKLGIAEQIAAEEEARINREIAEKTPEIKAWFANKQNQ